VTTYFYQIERESGRGILHDTLLPGCTLNSYIEAESWLHAKRALGFELTPLQEELVDLDQAARWRVLDLHRWEGMTSMLKDYMREMRDD